MKREQTISSSDQTIPGGRRPATVAIAALVGLVSFCGYGQQCCSQQPERQSGQQEVQSTDQTPVASQKYVVTPTGIEIRSALLPELPDGELAFDVLESLCRTGPRISGSEAMSLQQQMLRQHMEQMGATVILQPFRVLHPVNGAPVQMNNLIARWHPERSDRILIACHYDTRPFPDRDKENPRGLFLGANDGASGVGLLCELARYMPTLESEYGVDFVFFDGEEFVYESRRDPLFLGSTHFAREYVANPPAVRYSAGVLVDMIGDKDLNLYLEKNSWRHARQVTKQIWNVAADHGIKEFVQRTKHEVNDDHIPLIEIAGIPTCDIIDFDYPDKSKGNTYWHTEADTPENCSAESLAKVATVVLLWLRVIRSRR